MSPAPRTAAESISRLPLARRDRVSALLEDGGTWRQVAALCASFGLAGVRPQNVTNYRRSPAHKTYLARQSAMGARRERNAIVKDLMALAIEEGLTPGEALAIEVGAQLQDVLAAVDIPALLQRALDDDPSAALEIIRAAERLAKVKIAPRPPKADPSDSSEALQDRIRSLYGLAPTKDPKPPTKPKP